MNNSLSNGNSMLGSLLTARKNQAFTASSSAQDLKRDLQITDPSVRKPDKDSAVRQASTHDVTRAAPGKESADFRATMNEIANAKAHARREGFERAANKKSEQQVAERKLQERSYDKDRSTQSLRADEPVQSAVKRTPHPSSDSSEAKPETADAYPTGGESSSLATESMTDNKPATGNELLVLLADVVDQPSLGDETNVSGIPDGDENSLMLALVPGAETPAQGALASPLNPTGVSWSSVTDGSVSALATGQSLTVGQQLPGEASQSVPLSASGDIKPATVTAELTADAMATEESSSKESGNKMPLNGDLAADENKMIFGKLLATAQSNREGQAATQELTALKASASAPQVLEAATRSTETPAPAMRGFVVQTGVPMTMGQPRWGEAVGERVLWLAAQNLSSAELRLDPPELGPMQVRITIQQDQASISFASPHPGVREALDQSAVRLREMFNEQGLNLVNVDVSDQPLARHQRDDNNTAGGSASHDTDAEAGEEETVVGVSAKLSSARLIDHYA